jgi:lysophospholipase L1-like esterase
MTRAERGRERRSGRRALLVRLFLLVLVLGLTVVSGLRLADERAVAAQGIAPTSPAPAQRAAPSALFVGDSYTQGTGAGDTRRGYACLTAAAMGWNCNLDAQGGTGFLNAGAPGVPGSAPFIDRLAGDRARFLADVIVVDGGRNDGGLPLGDVVTAAASYLRELRRIWPKSSIIVVVPTYLWSTPENYGYGTGLAEALRPVLAGIGGHLIDPLSERWVAPEQVARFTWTDGIHPDAAGHEYLAERLTADLVRDGFSSLPVVDARAAATGVAG